MKKILTGVLATLCVGVAASALTTESVTASAAYLVYELTELNTSPTCVLTLEEAKVKNMKDWGYYSVDFEDEAWYFSGDGTATANPEVRFITDGTQTQTKPYTLVPMTVESFSFQYAIVNDKPSGVEDLSTEDYIVQILASDGMYPIIKVDVEADGDWHTITVDRNTPIYAGESYYQFREKFCGFLFKMGNLDGELLIKDIRIYNDYGAEILPEEDSFEDIVESSEEMLESSVEEIVESSEEIKSSEGAVVSSEDDGVISQSESKAEEKDGGCKSTVGAMTLTSIAAAGMVLGVYKKKKK